jgi:hypothetical protein
MVLTERNSACAISLAAALYRVDASGEVVPLIRRVPDPGTLTLRAGLVAVGDCSRPALLLVPVEGGEPRPVGEGCHGTLSPDGTQVAWMRQGVVWRGPVDGSDAPTRWFAVADAPGLARLLPPGPRDAFEMAWGEPGIAVVVGTDDDTAVVVAPRDGPLRVIDTLDASFMSFLQWQPGGRLLGMANGQTGGEGYLRLFDPADGSIRTVGLHPRGFIAASWSPPGDALVAMAGGGFFGSGPGGIGFLDLEGRRIGSMRGAGGFLFGWGA